MSTQSTSKVHVIGTSIPVTDCASLAAHLALEIGKRDAFELQIWGAINRLSDDLAALSLQFSWMRRRQIWTLALQTVSIVSPWAAFVAWFILK